MIIKNFLFHRVTDEKDELWAPMEVNLFKRIIVHLKKNFDVISLEEWLNDPSYFEEKSKPFATVSFDDGYKDNIEYAAPILKKYSCPASFYVVTDCIDRNIPTWTYIVDYTLQNTEQSKIELQFEFVPELLRKIALKTTLNNQLAKLKPWMKTLTNNKRLQVMRSVVDQCSDVSIPCNQMMNWNDLGQLHSQGFTVGSHTHTHPMLGRLEDVYEIETELRTSYDKIKEHLGFVPETISYPIGSYDERVIELSKKTGYKWGLAVNQRFYKPNNDDLLSIPRVELYQEPWWKVSARMHGIYNRLKQLW